MNTVLKTLLQEWRLRKLPVTVQRNTKLDTTKHENTHLATVVTGFRRVGKTYLFFNTINKLLKNYTKEDVIYINFEDERIVNPTVDFLTDLIPEIQTAFGAKPKFLFLDELQVIPNWSKWVRRILDTEDIQLFITGSSSKMSSYELPTELRGRALETKVDPLTFDEFLRFKEVSCTNFAEFKFQFNEFLVHGALPAVVLTDIEKKEELLQSYYQTVVQKEIADRNDIKNDVLLKTLLKLLLNSTNITISKLKNNIKSMGIPVGKDTVSNYLDFIESSYFMSEVYFHSKKMVNQLMYPRKLYFIDTGFLTALSTKFSRNMGRLFENAMYQKLKQQHENIFYYKDRNENEIDFTIVENEKVTSLYQICYDLSDEETQKRELKSLIRASKFFDCKDLNIVTFEKFKDFDFGNNIKIISAEELFK